MSTVLAMIALTAFSQRAHSDDYAYDYDDRIRYASDDYDYRVSSDIDRVYARMNRYDRKHYDDLIYKLDRRRDRAWRDGRINSYERGRIISVLDALDALLYRYSYRRSARRSYRGSGYANRSYNYRAPRKRSYSRNRCY